MKKLKYAIVFTVVMLASTSPSWAADAASAQADCDAVKQASVDAQNRYIQIHTPQANPVQVFDDAVSSCLDNISKFDLGLKLPGLPDLDKLLAALLQRVCQSATGQFNTAVNNARNTVNGAASTATGGMVSSPVSTGNSGTGVGTVSTDNGSTISNTVNTATNRIFNKLP